MTDEEINERFEKLENLLYGVINKEKEEKFKKVDVRNKAILNTLEESANCTEVQKKYKAAYPERIQSVLDFFDFDNCAKIANNEKWYYTPVTREHLIKDACKMFDELLKSETDNGGCDFLLSGHLIAIQLWNKLRGYYYVLTFNTNYQFS